MTDDEKRAWLAMKLAEIREHVDTARLFVTWECDDGSTGAHTTGSGNWHAQQGQVRAWIKHEDAYIFAYEQRRAQAPPDNDGDDWKQGAPAS